MPSRRGAGWLVFLLGLAACQAEPPAAATSVRVTLKGGPNPGTYTAAAGESACRRDLVGAGSWSVQLTDWAGPKQGLRSLQLMLPSRDHPDEFYLGLVFGDFFTGMVQEIETRPAAMTLRGVGRATVIRDRHADIVAIRGQTRDSVAITATITCQDGQERDRSDS